MRAAALPGAGIGRAIAQRLARQGDRVIVHYGRDAAGAEVGDGETRASLEQDGHLCLGADLEAPDGAALLIAAAVAQTGRLDVLVCNHGIYQETPFGATTAADWAASFAKTLRVNLEAPANLAFAAATHMAAAPARGGAIVFVSSRGAVRGEPDAPAYGASKAGLNALTGSLAQAFAKHGVRVAAVAPGFISTAMAEPVLQGARGDAIRAQSPFDRVGRPEEVADAVAYLASEEAAWSSGAVLDCNGASYLH
ncbi:hypothetical protein M885DRAFT_564749 [Pelagophyceae sp. CCMP2097]|nr:hypothetical protein M885DRAFT_564749 [Pelagophyceae sp. CCMP2097]